MKKLKRLFGILLQNLRAGYRVSITNQDTFREVFSADITKKGIYIWVSTIFLIVLLVFSALIFFTPLKYYIPGAKQDRALRSELIKLRHAADSLYRLNALKEEYVLKLISIAQGNYNRLLDTNKMSMSEIKRAELANLNLIDRASRYDYLRYAKKDTIEDEKIRSDSMKKEDKMGITVRDSVQ